MKHHEMAMVLVILRGTSEQFSDAISTKSSATQSAAHGYDASTQTLGASCHEMRDTISYRYNTKLRAREGLTDNYGWTWLPL